jgi:hypothetical protein
MRKSQHSKYSPVPRFSKSGKPMTYFIVSDDGQHRQVNRTDCLALSNDGTPPLINVDEEAGTVFRLPRNVSNEALVRENWRIIWNERKRDERSRSCRFKNTAACDGWKASPDGTRKCDDCHYLHTNRAVELDNPSLNESSTIKEMYSSASRDIADDFNLEAFIEDRALLKILYAALDELDSRDRSIINDIFWENKTERELAPKYGFKQSKSINQHKHRILGILRKNEALKNFFT